MYTHIKLSVLVVIRLLPLSLILYLGCTKPAEIEKLKDEKFSIVTTTTQVTDLVRRLTGENCRVISLMGPGVDPHLYKPTARDMTAISSADLVIYHGLKLEGKLAATLRKAKDLKVYSVCSVIPQGNLLQSKESEVNYPDPHVWFSPSIWIQCMNGLAKFLAKELPVNETEIFKKAHVIEKEFLDVAAWAKKQFNDLPLNKRILITSHDAFRYLGDFFGLKVIALQGISTVQEAGLGDRTNLVDYINRNKISCLFVESSVNPKALEEIAKETGISIGKPLFSDALGSEENSSIGPARKSFSHDTWSGMMAYNVRSIIDGLDP